MSKREFFHNATPYIFGNARQLRKNMTAAEKRLWNSIRGKQLAELRFRRQHPASTYILDFYCNELKLCIEVDGGIHNNPSQAAYDKDRENALATFGIKVIRFTNDQVMMKIEDVLDKIKAVAVELRNNGQQ